ncbi:MAG TPA: hypothetical protein VK816_04680 [Jatrophihabitantaceae bacterium]|nr:hypothetical protein [Jatrophihabitantaceae bacterium]
MTTFAFNYTPLGHISLAFHDAYLQSGSASHRLTLKFDVSASLLDPQEVSAVMPILVTGAAWTTNPGPGLRPLPGLRTAMFSVRGYSLQEDLVFDLSDDELYVLDRTSGLDAIAINFKLQATLLGTDPAVYPVSAQDFDLRIARSRWIELLDGVGAGVGITLRIPSPLTDAGGEPRPAANAETQASLAQAAERLRQARRQLRDRHWEQSVSTCRKVLENIAVLVELPTAKSVQAISAQDRTKEQRWAVTYYDLFSLTSAAHHETAEITFGQVDAEAILACTAALLLNYTS